MSRLTTSQHIIQTPLSLTPSEISQPHLPEWLLNLPGVPRVIDKLGITEFRRRLFHMSPALIPIGLPFIPHADVWGPILTTMIYVLAIVGFCVAVKIGPWVTREGEASWMRAVIGYMVPICLPFIFLPGRAELGLMTLQIIALGDGSATLGGLMIGGRRLPWNRKKTFSGLLCFTLVGSVAATYSYWGEASPAVPVGIVYLICATAAVAAAIVESLPIRSNDNLRVGLTALFVGIGMSTLLT